MVCCCTVVFFVFTLWKKGIIYVFTAWNMKVTKRQISMLLRTYFWCLQIFSAASQCLTFRRLYFVFTFTEVQPGINIATLCGNKMPTRCNRGFYCRSYCLLNIFRCITMPIIRSSRVLDSGCCLWYFISNACNYPPRPQS